MVLSLVLFGVVGGLAGWLITIKWGFNLWRIAGMITSAAFLFVILIYYIQTINDPKNPDYIIDMIRYTSLSAPEIIAANLGAVIAAAITDRR